MDLDQTLGIRLPVTYHLALSNPYIELSDILLISSSVLFVC